MSHRTQITRRGVTRGARTQITRRGVTSLCHRRCTDSAHGRPVEQVFSSARRRPHSLSSLLTVPLVLPLTIIDGHQEPAMSSSWPSSGESAENPFSSGSSLPDESAPRTPQTSTFESPLLPQDARDQPPSLRSQSRSFSANNFVSSPLNPNTPHAIRSRPASRGSTHFNRIASEESQALASQFSTLNSGQRGSMVLYRLATEEPNDLLLPPKTLHQRDSVASSSGDSIFSLSSDSKYPSGMVTGQRGFVPYAYDPDLDTKDDLDEDDFLRRPDFGDDKRTFWSWRGFLNVGVLVGLIAALLTLFICYPVLNFVRNNSRNLAIDGNIRINATGQAPVL